MKRSIKLILSLTLTVGVLLLSCTDNHSKAQKMLDEAQQLLHKKQYDLALLKIDTIQSKDPKAFEQIKAGLVLKQEIRKVKNERTILMCDSLLSAYKFKEDSLKKFFVFQQDKKYQETGVYVPKETSATTLSGNILRSGIQEDGEAYLESVYLGTQLHDKMEIKSKDGSSVKTLAENGDGLNFRFSNLGRQYEIIKFTKATDNGVFKFIASSTDKQLTVNLEGKGKTQYVLSSTLKNALSRSYQLSTLLMAKDSILRLKDKSNILNKYLDTKR